MFERVFLSGTSNNMFLSPLNFDILCYIYLRNDKNYELEKDLRAGSSV
jgi:hypothetical protein